VSTAVTVTLVVPRENDDPLVRDGVTDRIPQLSVTVAERNVTFALQDPDDTATTMFVGHVMVGATLSVTVT